MLPHPCHILDADYQVNAFARFIASTLSYALAKFFPTSMVIYFYANRINFSLFKKEASVLHELELAELITKFNNEL